MSSKILDYVGSLTYWTGDGFLIHGMASYFWRVQKLSNITSNPSMCSLEDDSFILLDYKWSDLEDEVSPGRRMRYSPVKNGETSGIELSSSLEIDVGLLVTLMSSPSAAVSSTAAADTGTSAAVQTRPAFPITWTVSVSTTTTTVPAPAPTEITTAVPLRIPVVDPGPTPPIIAGPDKVVCPALGCIAMGTTEALGTHWLNLHEADKMLWLCPMPQCHMKSRSTRLLDIWRKASRPMVRRLREEIPPLVEWVVNRKHQFPGVARPQLPCWHRCQLRWAAGTSWQCNHQHHHLLQGYRCRPDCLQQSCHHRVQSWHWHSHHQCHHPCCRHFQHQHQSQLHQACFRHCQYHCRHCRQHLQFPHPCCRHCPVCHCRSATTTSFLKIAAATAQATVDITTTSPRFTAATITSPDVINSNVETGATLCLTRRPLQGVYTNQHQQQ